jgi:hypothetical protein
MAALEAREREAEMYMHGPDADRAFHFSAIYICSSKLTECVAYSGVSTAHVRPLRKAPAARPQLPALPTQLFDKSNVLVMYVQVLVDSAVDIQPCQWTHRNWYVLSC